ncbi:MAG: sulfatase [Nitrospirae bacterium]|nr:sulfatase [Nitrospirota bacterium]
MKPGKSFLIILRIVFIIFSVLFIRDAFYKWDGYSFYMRFMDFLPDLSLSFVLWTIPVLPLSVMLWTGVYLLNKLTLVFRRPVPIEGLLVCFVLISLLLAVKLTLLSRFSIGELTGINRYWIIIIIIFASVVFTISARKYMDRMLTEFNARITPLVWIFLLLFVTAVPFSFIKADSEGAYPPVHSEARHDGMKQKYPNIILVVMDTLTARDMQVYGYERPTTPFISEWAKDAVVFNSAYASSNWTSPTVMSLMTGQRPWTHGIWHMTNQQARSAYVNSLPAVLKDHGYDIYGFVQNRYAHPDTLGIRAPFNTAESYYTFWISNGWWFDELAAVFAERNVVKEWIFENNEIADLINAYRPAMSDTLFPPEKVYGSFLDYMSQTDRNISDRPFFAWLQLYPPHNPYLPPEPYRGMFGDAGRFSTDSVQERSGLLETGYDAGRQADIDILRKRYDEFILYSDRQFELFISRLSETMDMSNTVIILTGDHGESFEHGYQGHSGAHLYESIVHVPLMVKLPGGIHRKAIDMQTEQIDIAPTILELSGIPAPQWMEGRSLLPLIEGRAFHPEPVFSMQFIENKALGEPITKGTIAVWDGEYKFIYYLEANISLLFNLKNDPDEMHNIINEKPAVAEELKKLINRGLSGANEEIVGSGNNK